MVDLGDPTGELDGSVLKLSQLLVSPLPPTGVRVRVWASSLNFADLLQAQVQAQLNPEPGPLASCLCDAGPCCFPAA